MEFNSFLREKLQKIKDRDLYRERFILENGVIDFSSNDYLGLRDNPVTKGKLCKKIEKIPLGSGASALISGYTQIQQELETFLSEIKETESCLVVGSGYLANTGLLQAVITEKDTVFSDQYNHASIIDGIRLSKAKKVIYRHNDINDLEDKLKKNNSEGFKFIVTDGVFSMEGDIAPLKEIKYLSDKYKAILIIDDAHGTGVLGEGRGTVYHFGIKPDENLIQVGTLSKAVGSYGAFICGTEELIQFLINRMRTQIFSTALSPVQNFISLENLTIMMRQPERRRKVLELSKQLYEKAKEEGIDLNYHGTPILTLIVGEEKKALFVRDKLLENGIFVQAIRPPTVPEGSSRLRITVSYKHSENDINLLVKSLKNVLESYHG
ncbi:glycine C-acetyltransferase/8-amino-7-oxononanoate synthase [Persephonella hydrogeniphila]|uniref:8-amino-7-ketopelargonate synthase n=1 Tax=Persephonella hydrogeniphila TaxID=198703 RepID=A0A285NG84_9AQUI|nr:8-amino-7-oxononanoate synthase [Persephonella hydrogeniphila]SNZ08522.1 glycine C-acetyltransferase/8-amino-7-oxononanoate synthase [Persephonella hydrogeniphila]